MAKRRQFGGIEVNGGAAGRMMLACFCGQCWRVLAHLEPVGRREIAVWLSMRCPAADPPREVKLDPSTSWATEPGDPLEDIRRGLRDRDALMKRSGFRVVPPA